MNTAFDYTFPVNAFYDLNEDTLSYSVTGLPGWLSFDAATRRVSGTPPSGTVGQASTITITASDGKSADVSDTFTLTVIQGSPAAPANVRAVTADGSITLLWDAATDTGGYPVQNYQIHQVAGGSSTLLDEVSASDATSFTHTGLNNGEPYTYTVTVRTGPSADDIRFSTISSRLISTPTGATFGADAFVTVWRTSANGQTLTIPTHPDLTYAYSVDWGDGSTDTDTYTGNAEHTYTTAGARLISITGVFPQIYFNGGGDLNNIRTVKQWGTNQWRSMESSFTSCLNLVIESGAGRPDLSAVTDMSRMFLGATNFNSPIGDWDVSTVTNMAQMFQNADAFNQDVSGWEVGAVTDMSRMFNGADVFNSDISTWDVGAVTVMTAMFNDAVVFNQDVSGWDVSRVTGMAEMFQNATAFERNLGAWDISSVTSASNMLNGVTLSRANYDALLAGWSRIEGGESGISSDVSFHAGGSQYCDAPARARLTATPSAGGLRTAGAPRIARWSRARS